MSFFFQIQKAEQILKNGEIRRGDSDISGTNDSTSVTNAGIVNAIMIEGHTLLGKVSH